MINKTMKNNFKKSGVKSLCAMMIAASMMSMAVPAFAETNEDVDVCREAETNTQDALMPLTEMPAPVQEAVPVEETEVVQEAVAVEEGEYVPENISIAEVLAALQETAPIENEECIQEAPNQMETADMTDNEGDSVAETESPATTETQDTTSNYKPILDADRAAWIYRELNPNWDLEDSGEAKEEIQVEPVGVVEPMDRPGLYRVRKRDATEEEIMNGEYDEAFSYNTKTDQYDIQPGKFYHLVTSKENPDWEPMSLGECRRRTIDMTLVKVLDVYEDSKWYGSERTVEYIDIATGEIKTVQPNANKLSMLNMGTINSFYEVYSVKRIIERRHV